MKKCCVDTAYRVEEDYRKRVKELEAAMQEYIDTHEFNQTSFNACHYKEKFKELLK